MISADNRIQDYLRRLERAASGLPADRRQDLLEGIREHIAAARSAGPAFDEAAVRTLLDRLGEPHDIVAAAREDDGVTDGGGPRRAGTWLELAAVLMLTAGSFVPVVGWLVGVVLLWTSRLWRVREKVLGTLVVPLGPGGVLLLGSLPLRSTEVCSSAPVPVGSSLAPPTVCTNGGPPDWLAAVVVALILVASVVVPVLLLRIARRRAELPGGRTSAGG